MSRAAIFKDKTAITEKIREAAASVLPIVLIVVLLCFGVLPVGTDVMLSFITGTLFVILGIGLFSLGADISMVPIGTKRGAWDLFYLLLLFWASRLRLPSPICRCWLPPCRI